MNTKIDFLYLNEPDMLKAGVADMARCVDTMEEVFVLMDKEDYRMGGPNGNEHGIVMSFPNTSDILNMPLNGPDKRVCTMPAYIGGRFHMSGIKSYGSNLENKKEGLPRSILMLTLIDPESGVPQAFMSANVLRAMRTGAVPGLGSRHLSSKNPEIAAIVGPGVMGKTAIDAFMATQPSITTLKIKGRSQAGIDAFLAFCKKKFPQIKKYVVCDTCEEACKDSDIIYFGTTNAAKFEDNPHLKAEWLKKGCLVITTTALLMDPDFLFDTKRARLVTDDYKMYEGWGTGHELPTQKTVCTLIGMAFYDLVVSGKIQRSDITDIGEIISGKKPARENDDQIVVYAVGGLPIEDVAWGYECLKKAKELGLGTKLNLWDTPEMA